MIHSPTETAGARGDRFLYDRNLDLAARNGATTKERKTKRDVGRFADVNDSSAG
jgi:hypothetical protein